MIAINIILILLYCSNLSFQTIRSALFCDDRLLNISVYDERGGSYKYLQSVKNPEDGYHVDYIDLDVDPGALIKFSCRNDASETLGGGCFLINNKCHCYDFKNTERYGYNISIPLRQFHIDFNNGITCEHTAAFLADKRERIYEYYHNVPLDIDEIKCNPKTIFAPINIKRSLKFSDFIESSFNVTNLKISVNKNYQIFTLNNRQLSTNTIFNILSEIEYFSNQSSLIDIQFINYGIVLDNTKTCELSIRFCYDSCLECDKIEPNERSHQCLKCKDDFYFIENTNNCMTIKEMENSSYYLDRKEKIFRHCPRECSTCDNETFCSNCSEGYHFIYNEIGKCIREPKAKDLLYLDTKTNTYMKCPEGTEKVENNECIKSSNSTIIILLLIFIILIILFAIFFYIKRYVSKKNLENDLKLLGTIEKENKKKD